MGLEWYAKLEIAGKQNINTIEISWLKKKKLASS